MARYAALGVGLLVILVGGYWYFFAGELEITNYPSKGNGIIAFGDSLVVGAGATEGNDFVSVLSRRVGEDIVNLGVNGDTTADGVARLNQLDAYAPKVVLLLLGGNDYLRRIPAEETFANLATIIENIEARGAIVVLLGIRGGLLRDRFESRFEALAKQYKTAYVPDVLSGLLGHQNLMSDQVHPSDAGYAIIAGRVEPVLKPLLQ